MRWSTMRWSTILLVLAAVSGLAAVYLSSDFSRDFGLREGPLPHEYPPAALLAFALAGAFLLFAVLRRPALFWSVLVVTAMVTPGMFVLGFPIFDEWLIGCATLGAAIAALAGRLAPRLEDRQARRTRLFLLLALYLAAEGVAGLLLYKNLRAVRFVLAFGVVFCMAWLLSRYSLPHPSPRAITLLVAGAGAAYYALYLAHGLVFMDLVFVYSMEGIGGAGAAYANFSMVAAVPAAILLLAYGPWTHRLLGWTTIVLGCIAAILGDSRAGFVALLLSAAASFVAVGFRPVLKLTAGLAATCIVAGAVLWSNPYYLESVYTEIEKIFEEKGGTEVVVQDGKSLEMARGDSARVYLLEGAIATICRSPVLFLVGGGIYGYWPNAEPVIDELRARYGSTSKVLSYASSLGAGPLERPRPPAWPAFIVETGCAGVLLLLAAAFACVWRVAVRLEPGSFIVLRSRLLIAAVPVLGLFWGTFGEIQDNMLLYVILAPFGLADAWSRGPPWKGT